jgi:hypothetical protein
VKQRGVETDIGRDPHDIPPVDRMVTHLVPLRFADINEVRNMLTPLISKDGDITAYGSSNTIILKLVGDDIPHVPKKGVKRKPGPHPYKAHQLDGNALQHSCGTRGMPLPLRLAGPQSQGHSRGNLPSRPLCLIAESPDLVDPSGIIGGVSCPV